MMKLLNKSGETLVETLCAVIVVTLASVMLMGTISTSTALNHDTTVIDNDLGAQQTAAEGAYETGSAYQDSKPGTVTFEASDGTTATVKVQFHGGDDIASYEYDG